MRVNLVNPEFLCDQHLLAEYRESFMLPGSLKRWLKTQSTNQILEKIPKKFCLGPGHILFFADKGIYMKKRYELLISELLKRGFKLDENRNQYPLDVHPSEFRKDYVPDQQALLIIQKRISEKIMKKPWWYRYFGVKFTELDNSIQRKLLFIDDSQDCGISKFFSF